jgi:hypothetical protein
MTDPADDLISAERTIITLPLEFAACRASLPYQIQQLLEL